METETKYTIETIITKYNNIIVSRYKDLINAEIAKEDYTNNHLCKIFEYYSCIQLMKEYKQCFYEYEDIKPEFKEFNNMSRSDTGVDACNLIDTIVQCKLRKDNLTWRECGTFFGSQNIFNEELKEIVVRWKKMIITRNSDCDLSKHFESRANMFLDKTYDKNEMIIYCKELVKNYIEVEEVIEPIVLRDYQVECIKLIKDSIDKNIVINLPTGTGKNLIILHSLKAGCKYLILVPRIILMEQIKEEIKKHFPKLSKSVQCIGDGNDIYNEKKNICICVYNSIDVVKNYLMGFEKIFVDEAHHIKTPMIYQEQDLENSARKCEENTESNEEDSSESDAEDSSEEDSIEDDKEARGAEALVDEDENYLKEISSLYKYNNNVYLSATIDKQDGFEYYSKDIREMIEKGYLCDYTINIPIFSEDPTNKSVCEYLIKNYNNIIIYCNSQIEGNKINKLMNSIQKGSSQYIDCKTSKKQRDIIIKKYKAGEIPFLVNVRILVEGFDASITKGVCFMHLPSSSTTLIQIIGRALRLHKNKTIANVILPFSSKCDETSICRFLNVIAKNDSRVRKSYETKKLGGYINIGSVGSIDEEVSESRDGVELKFNMVFDSMGKIKNSVELWINRLEEVKKYIDENGKRPSHGGKNKSKYIKQLSKWLCRQNIFYEKKLYCMKNDIIYNTWNEFINNKKYKTNFLSYEEHFNMNLNKVKKYIDENNKKPTESNKDKNIKILGKWISQQITNYNNKKYNMKDEIIYNKWNEFINNDKYKKYFQSQYEDFIINLEKIKKYIDKNNIKPLIKDENDNIKLLGRWIHRQQINYKTKQNNMKDINIYNKWTEFITSEKYKKYFEDITMEKLFDIYFKKVKDYIDKNNKKPTSYNKNRDIKFLGTWIARQIKNYKNKNENMKDENIYNKMSEFINNEKYKKYFILPTTEEYFNLNLEKVKKYINENNKRPCGSNKDKDIKTLGIWIANQNKNYKKKFENMKDENIYNKWTEFINNAKYKQYFKIL
jgi:hypothetical protein